MFDPSAKLATGLLLACALGACSSRKEDCSQFRAIAARGKTAIANLDVDNRESLSKTEKEFDTEVDDLGKMKLKGDSNDRLLKLQLEYIKAVNPFRANCEDLALTFDHPAGSPAPTASSIDGKPVATMKSELADARAAFPKVVDDIEAACAGQ